MGGWKLLDSPSHGVECVVWSNIQAQNCSVNCQVITTLSTVVCTVTMKEKGDMEMTKFWGTFNIQALPQCLESQSSVHLLDDDTLVMESLYLVYASILQSSDLARIAATAQSAHSTYLILATCYCLLRKREKESRSKRLMLFFYSLIRFSIIHNLE